MTDRMTDKNSENPTEAQNAVELRHEHPFDDDDMIQPDSNDHSQRLRDELNNWQNTSESIGARADAYVRAVVDKDVLDSIAVMDTK
ncbi:hypothetical protein O9G_005580 [Rozella allomycis CSF55]|uniref:Uncharacterized protein n=1 Tax=Rozella allomycis (strain CSF55) TaxID=988480 RepID=A0A075B376_ROZAC|nr:hypothetical protein O9G_005580 [Rozella allomycis CSF55]|eukprot:EPZ37038.1 hypothetical protein O9G_005580 [Rozella allomycis CSF55]